MAEDGAYLGRTLRSGAFVLGFALFVLASYGHFWALLPVAAGFGLAAGLLWGWDRFIRSLFTPERMRKEKNERKNPTAILLGFALVKYPLVAFLLWWLVQIWETRHLMAFAGGFLLLHLIIGLRALGRILTARDKQPEKRQSK